MREANSTFERYADGLLSVLEHIPIPIAVGYGADAYRVVANAAFRKLTGSSAGENLSFSAPRDGDGRPYRLFRNGAELLPEELPMQRSASGEDISDFDIELRRADGTTANIVASAWPVRDESGTIAGSIGVFLDVTQRRAAEEQAAIARRALENSERRYRLIAEAMPQFVWLDAVDGSALYANERWLQYTGLTDEENQGWGWQRVVHPDDQRRLQAERERSLRTGETFEGECRYRGRDGKYRWFLFRSIAVLDEQGHIASWLGTATDIDKQKRAEFQQRFFAQASASLASTLDVAGTLRRAARLGASLGTWCQIDLADEDGLLKTAVTAHEDPAKAQILERLVGRYCFDPSSPAGPPAVFRTNRWELILHTDENVIRHVIPDDEFRSIYREAGYACGMVVPLQVADRTIGTLGIASADTTQLYTEFDVATALELARRVATAIENAQIFAREHRLASTLQRALLPARLPQTDAVSFCPAYVAASSAEGEAVGGDWYDAFALRDGSIAFSIGDVAGHGVDAAVTMNVVRQALRAAALEGLPPHAVLSRANDLLGLDANASMVTAFFGILDDGARSLSYAIAGHPRPLLLQTDGSVESFGESGAPLGSVFDPEFVKTQTQPLAPGDTIVLYTDGLLEYDREIENAERRLLSVVAERRFLAAPNAAQRLIDEALLGEQRDDIAVLLVTVHARPEDTLRLRIAGEPYAAPVVRGALERYARVAGVSDDQVFAVLTATGEALANSVEHAFSSEIEVRARFDGTQLVVSVRDFGTWRKPHLDPDRGLGTGLMEALAQAVVLDRTSEGTTVTMTFTI